MKMNQKIKTTMSLAASLALASSANAATMITVLNASFEDTAANDGSAVSDTVVSWTGTGSFGTQDFNTSVNTSNLPVATDGEQHAYTNGTNNGLGTLSQVTGHTIVAGETYTLTVDVGQVHAFSGSEARIWLFGNTGGVGTNFAENAGIVANNQGGYLVNQTVTFTAGAGEAGQSLGIAISGGTNTTQGVRQVLFDNVRLEFDVVPEPSSAALLGLGGLALIFRRRK